MIDRSMDRLIDYALKIVATSIEDAFMHYTIHICTVQYIILSRDARGKSIRLHITRTTAASCSISLNNVADVRRLS